MDPYLIVVLILFNIFIVCAIFINLILKYEYRYMTYNSPNTCPDLWTLSSDEKNCISYRNINAGNTVTGNGNTVSVSIASMGNTKCSKKSWAINNAVYWYGISNYGGC